MMEQEGPVREISFKCGRVGLVGTLHLPLARPLAAVIGSHGMLANRMSAKQIALARACNRSGIAYFRFDHRGCGQSQGELALKTILEDRRRDLLAAIDEIRDLLGPDIALGLFGSSLGGTVVLQVAAETGILPIVTVAAPVKMSQISQAAISSLRHQGLIMAAEDREFGFDITACLDGISGIMVLHGGLDDIVPVSNAHIIYERAKEPKRMIILPDSDHAFSRPSLQDRLVGSAHAWLQSHLAGC